MAPEKYSFTYFNARGRGEAMRLVFAAAGKKFEDKRVNMPDWPALKPSTPHGSMPILVVDGMRPIPQSMAIMRFLAREFDLYGKNREDNAWVDVYLDTICELFGKAFNSMFGDEDKKKALKEALEKTEVPKFLALFEKTASDKKGYLVGCCRTVADIYFYSLVETLKLEKAIESFPKLKASYDGIHGDCKIKAHIKARPETPF